MWLAMLIGCASWGPRNALEEVDRALAESDRAALEAVVDVDQVVPAMAATCARLFIRQELEEVQFRAPGPITGFDRTLGDQSIAAWLADPEKRAEGVDIFRAAFPVLPREQCPALDFNAADAELTRLADDRWRADAGGWAFTLAREDAGWRVVSANGDALVAAREKEALEAARTRAAALVAGLADGAPPDDWEALRAYTARNPREADIVARFGRELGTLESAPSLRPVSDTGFYMPNNLIPVRHVTTRVALDAPVSDLVVRFALANAEGEPVTSNGTTRAVVVQTGPAFPGDVRVSTRAGKMSWSDATSAVATVVEIRYADGRIDRHPAVEAGAWLAVPNSEPHGANR